MDGIEKIIERINSASAEECAAIAQQAERDCELIRADYARKIQSAYDSAIKNGELEINLDADHLVRNARLDARKDILSVKQELLDKLFEAAKVKLRALPEDEYISWLASLISQVSDGGGEIILAPQDKQLGDKLLAKAQEAMLSAGKKPELSISDECRDIEAGFVLLDGRTEVNCSISTLVGLKRQEIASKLAEQLFA